jgi:hypothetical protein
MPKPVFWNPEFGFRGNLWFLYLRRDKIFKNCLDRSETGSLGGLVRFFSNWHDNITCSILGSFIMKKIYSLGFVKTLYIFISENN